MPGIRLPFNCVVCNIRTTPKNRRKINVQLKQQILKRFPVTVKETDVICNKCRLKHFCKSPPVSSLRYEEVISDLNSDDDFNPPISKRCAIASPPSVRLSIPATPKSHSRCFICKRPGPKLIVVPAEARFSAFAEHNIIIKSGTRCCPVHTDASKLKDDALKSANKAESAYVNRATVLELLTKLREAY
ncbi:uncharacterized protein LOC128551967 [Mercenaria mercenaria]|uniref:uncharacterized protein LOC128551967 n=1 Tax=Mercenaria mercenaria TaxID=6596 RepID=UPI00234F101D|nr:uncharacterized protein LOC128551967 [Mercenaria mercenaria]